MGRKNKQHGPRGAMTDEELEHVVRAYIEYEGPEYKAVKRTSAMKAVSYGRSTGFIKEIELAIRQGHGRRRIAAKAINLYRELSVPVDSITHIPASSDEEEFVPDFIEAGDEMMSSISIRFNNSTFTMDVDLTASDIINRLGVKEFNCKTDN